MKYAETHFELNQKLLEDIIVNLKRVGDRKERRKSPRQKFPVKQMMAPFYRKMPRADEFVPISCLDLSTTGVAFYWPYEPDFTKAIIGLGGQSMTYLAARVVRHERCRVEDRVLVGCEFVDRVGIKL